MKQIFIIFIILWGIFCRLPSFAYENQGFSQYSETEQELSFTCDTQCFIILGEKETTPHIRLEGNIEGTGSISYGFFDGTSIIPGERYMLLDKLSENIVFTPISLPYIHQIPKKNSVVLIIEGRIQSQNLHINIPQLGFFEKTYLLWDNFWTFETLTPYSINLRYGVKLSGISIVTLLSLFSLLIIGGTFLTSGNKRKNIIFFTLAFCFLFISVRNMMSYALIVQKGLQQYTFQEGGEKRFFDLGDYPAFTKQIRNTLSLEKKEGSLDCRIYIESYADWPFKAHWDLLYLRPCVSVSTAESANYLLYYGIKPKFLSGTILLETNNGLLLQK